MRIHGATARRLGVLSLALTMTTAAAVLFAAPANAAIVPTIGLGSSANYSVLGGQTVTNTGPSSMSKNLGVYPGSTAPGFPPGQVIAPGVIHLADPPALAAQSALNAAYTTAMNRPVNETHANPNLGGLTLQGGVHAIGGHGAMQVNGPLVLDGAGNANTVFIFQTDSSLITASGSTVSLINGAQECNVFWQVGSSATLNTGSVFRGNILAQTSIFVRTGVVVHGRALAQTGEVTLQNDTFVNPTCASSFTPPTPVTTPATTPGGGGGPGTTPTAGTPGTGTGTGIDTGLGEGPGTPISGPPRTGGAPLQSGDGFPWFPLLFVGLALAAGTTDVVLTRRHRAHELARVTGADHLKSS